MKKVKWGVISTANIGLQKVLPGMLQSRFCDIAAISSRSIEKAKDAANALGIPRAYGSYEELLADPDIEAIYNPLPNHLHIDWTIKALEAGKHVLCEKPLGMSSSEVARLVEAMRLYPKLKVMEAFMYRFHPQWSVVIDWVRSGKIGELKHVQSFFTYYNANPENIRNIAEAGGGGLMDIGCYCISFARYLFGRQPNRVLGIVEKDPVLQTDRMTSGLLDFGRGTSNFTCSTQLTNYQRVQILGTIGRIEVEIPVNAPTDTETRVLFHSLDGCEEATFPGCNQYALQGDAFSRAILDGAAVPTPLSDALENMAVIDAVFESAAESKWVEL